jgi:hypothetical protein
VGHKHFDEIRIGDWVRLTDEREGGAWTVVGRSFGSMTLDLAAADPKDAGRVLRAVRAASVQRVEPVTEQET